MHRDIYVRHVCPKTSIFSLDLISSVCICQGLNGVLTFYVIVCDSPKVQYLVNKDISIQPGSYFFFYFPVK